MAGWVAGQNRTAGGVAIVAAMYAAGGAAPNAPTPGTPVITGSTTVTLPWTDNSGDETSFVVQIDSGAGFVNASGSTNPTAANAVAFNATGLPAATLCHWRVGATNANGTTYATGADFTTDNPGGGGGGLDPDGGSSAAVTVAAAGAGTKAEAGGSPATVTVGAAGAGMAPGAGSGGSSASVTVSAAGAGNSSGSGTGSSVAEIWGYVMANGQTAEANVLAILALLQSGTIGVDVQYMNGAEVIGDGSEGNKWRGVGVPN